MRSTRWRFWWQLAAIALSKPQLVFDYFVALGTGEYFFAYRHEVRDQLGGQLGHLQKTGHSDALPVEIEAPACPA